MKYIWLLNCWSTKQAVLRTLSCTLSHYDENFHNFLPFPRLNISSVSPSYMFESSLFYAIGGAAVMARTLKRFLISVRPCPA